MAITTRAWPVPSQRRGSQATPGGAPFAAPSRFAILIGVAVGAAVVAVLAGVAVGAVGVPLPVVLRVVGQHVGAVAPTVTGPLEQIVWDIRIPRVLLGLLVGGGLAVSGVVVQAVVRNPLGDAYLLGITPGGGLGAVTVIVLGSSAVGGVGLSLGAFAGALASFAVTVLLARTATGWSPLRLVLAGVAVGYALSAATFFLQVLATPNQVQRALFWTLGSLARATWADLAIPAGVVVASTLWVWMLGPRIDALAHGSDATTSLGIDVARLQLVLMVVTAVLTGCLVAVAGGVGFVGLIVPHVARMLVGADHRRVVTASALIGAGFVVLVDLGARTALQPVELPIGILTAATGAPMFIWLLRRRGARGAV